MSIIMLNDTQRAKQCLLPLDIAAYRACIDQRGAVGAIANMQTAIAHIVHAAAGDVQ
mgnify:CR=1 FL=1